MMCPGRCRRIGGSWPEEELEITPAMIDAGVMELSFCESFDSWWSTAEAVYRAMELARRLSLLEQ